MKTEQKDIEYKLLEDVFGVKVMARAQKLLTKTTSPVFLKNKDSKWIVSHLSLKNPNIAVCDMWVGISTSPSETRVMYGTSDPLDYFAYTSSDPSIWKVLLIVLQSLDYFSTLREELGSCLVDKALSEEDDGDYDDGEDSEDLDE